MTSRLITQEIKSATEQLGTTWPLYSYVTSNPLAGYQHKPFDEALELAKRYMAADGYPSAAFFEQAWINGEIDHHLLNELLQKNLLFQSPGFYLSLMKSWVPEKPKNQYHELDRIMAKWLSGFMDEGVAEWAMPNREQGFYNSWLSIAPYDSDLPYRKKVKNLDDDAFSTIKNALSDIDLSLYSDIFNRHLNALPGWVGYIKYRMEFKPEWHKKYPMDTTQYLAVRLATAKMLHLPILPELYPAFDAEKVKIKKTWLNAWERSWQESLKDKVLSTIYSDNEPETQEPEAQLVFCIDTRSELIRKKIEQQGPFETYGYAGFFGIDMEYHAYDNDTHYASCPPILEARYQVTEQTVDALTKTITEVTNKEKFDSNLRSKTGLKKMLKSLKNSIPSAFGYVEGAGWLYGIFILARTLFPSLFASQKSKKIYEAFCEPEITKKGNYHKKDDEHLSVDEKAQLVKTAFDMMGWDTFAPIVIFAGHESETTNNPFASSLDCGACAGNAGRHNARLLAKLANESEVRFFLNHKYGFQIPEDTLFVGGSHNTTTDEIILFDHHLPEGSGKQMDELKKNLKAAQQEATAERLGRQQKSAPVVMASKKANDWAETRPEWGLATNSGFIVGKRSLTVNLNLEGQCFLHSYNWQNDTDGTILKNIMQGPMVVTQWINNHYYFSTTDNELFGSGSKITQNVVSTFGLVQGNGGDLKRGLPLQSLYKTDTDYYHRPIRLTVLLHAPLQRVEDILKSNPESLQMLPENNWIYLMVLDPMQDNRLFTYQKNMNWQAEKEECSAVMLN